jgi:hypothetical protein
LSGGEQRWRILADGTSLGEAGGSTSAEIIHAVIIGDELWSDGQRRPLAQAARREGQRVAVVATPGLTLKDVLVRCQQLGAARCVLLPAAPPGLLPIEGVIGTPSSERSGALMGDGGLGLGGDGSGDPGQLGQIGVGENTAPRVKRSEDQTEQGGMRDVIRRILKHHNKQVRGCYERALAREPQLAGRVSIKFTISPQGDVSSAEVAQDTLADPEVGRCVQGVILKLTFPTSDAPLIINYPFTFQPG